MDSTKILKKVEDLIIDKGWNKNYVCKQAGVSSNTFYNWKTRNTIPKLEILEALCDVLQISVLQLISDEDTTELPDEHKKLLELWSTLSPQHKKLVLDTIKTLRGIT